MFICELQSTANIVSVTAPSVLADRRIFFQYAQFIKPVRCTQASYVQWGEAVLHNISVVSQDEGMQLNSTYVLVLMSLMYTVKSEVVQ